MEGAPLNHQYEAALQRLSDLDRHFGSAVLLQLTSTMLSKSIIDAIAPVRALLRQAGVHDFDAQLTGPDHKVTVPTTIISEGALGAPEQHAALTSLYRPLTKQGDPRLWVGGLAKHTRPGDIVAVAVDLRGHLVAVVLTAGIAGGVGSGVYWSQVLDIVSGFSPAALRERSSDLDSLLERLEAVHTRGWLPAVCSGDTAVGRTLETALGIPINSSKKPDWGGVELKFSRHRPAQRKNLFAQVPDWELSPLKSSAEILEAFGYVKDGVERLYVEVGAQPNSRGLYLRVDDSGSMIQERSTAPNLPVAVVWRLAKLLERLTEKHTETLWITCQSRSGTAGEEFLPTDVIHTTGPRLDRFAVLVEAGDITVDHLIKRGSAGRAHEKGPIWKVSATGHPSLFGTAKSFPLGR